MLFKSPSTFETGSVNNAKKEKTKKFSGKEFADYPVFDCDIETQEGKEKTNKYIKSRLYGALEKGAFAGVSLFSCFLWLIKEFKDKMKEAGISELKGAFKGFKISE